MKPRDSQLLSDLVEELCVLLEGDAEAPGLLKELHDEDLQEFVHEVVGSARDAVLRRIERGLLGHEARDGTTYQEQPLVLETA